MPRLVCFLKKYVAQVMIHLPGTGGKYSPVSPIKQTSGVLRKNYLLKVLKKILITLVYPCLAKMKLKISCTYISFITIESLPYVII